MRPGIQSVQILSLYKRAIAVKCMAPSEPNTTQ